MAGLQPNGDTEPAPSVTPNPMRTGGHLAFTTSRVGSIILRVFDAHGRVVGRLLDQSPTPVGIHVVALEGRGVSDVPMRSCVYFYEIRSGEAINTGRFVIMR